MQANAGKRRAATLECLVEAAAERFRGFRGFRLDAWQTAVLNALKNRGLSLANVLNALKNRGLSLANGRFERP